MMKMRTVLSGALVTPVLLLSVGATTSAQASPPPTTDPPSISAPASSAPPHAGDEVSEQGAAEGATELEQPAPRLVVADGDSGAVEVVDLVTGEALATLDAGGVSSLVGDGRFVFAVATDDDLVTMLDGGAWVVDHGDHVHAFSKDPSVIGTFEGPTPIHTVVGDDQTLVFFDGDGTAAAFAADDIADRNATPALTLTSAGPHHGVAAALQGHYVVSVPGPTTEDLPTGVEVRHGADEVEADFSEDCPEMHGEAAFDDGVLFACDGGALWVTGGEGEWTATTIEWPAATSGEARAWSFAHTHDVPVVAGVAGEGLVTVNVESGTAARIASPGDVMSLAVIDNGAALLVVTRDGTAHLVDAATGDVVASAPVVSAVPADAAGYDPVAPKIAVSGTRAYITDAAAGAVVEVALNDDLRVARTIDVSVTPGALAVVGDVG